MLTDCNPKLFQFEALGRKAAVAGFDGEAISSNAGTLLLGQVDHRLVARFNQSGGLTAERQRLAGFFLWIIILCSVRSRRDADAPLGSGTFAYIAAF